LERGSKNYYSIIQGVKMTERSITCFLSVAHTGNVSVTALDLSITQQAVSRNIQKLEQELGFSLFHRNHDALVLTAAGNKYYQLFSGLATSISETGRLLSKAEGKRIIRLGSCEWCGCPQWLRTAVKDFTAERTDTLIEIRITPPSELIGALTSGEIDVAFTSRYLARNIKEPCYVLSLSEERLNIVLGADSLLVTDTINPETLSFVPHITTYAGESSEDEIISRTRMEYSTLDFTPRVISVVPNLDSVYLEVYMKNGITFSPLNGKLVNRNCFKLIPLPLTVTFCVASLYRNSNPAVRDFCEYICNRRREDQ
jgi:DNA-binding transcriptional LysR family regulator